MVWMQGEITLRNGEMDRCSLGARTYDNLRVLLGSQLGIRV